MKRTLFLFVIVLASCAKPGAIELGTPISLNGRLIIEPYNHPNGRSESSAIELNSPIIVNSLQNPVTKVELILSEKDHVSWGPSLGKQATITCSLTTSSLWGYPNVACQPTNVVLGSN